MKRKTREVNAWAGFIDGKLDWHVVDANFSWAARLPAIYRTKAEATERYEDVRRVTIRVQP